MTVPSPAIAIRPAVREDTGRILALGGTLALFEFPVWLLGNLLRHVHTYGYSVHLFCFGVSLPWLVGSLWATWLLRQELQIAS